MTEYENIINKLEEIKTSIKDEDYKFIIDNVNKIKKQLILNIEKNKELEDRNKILKEYNNKYFSIIRDEINRKID